MNPDVPGAARPGCCFRRDLRATPRVKIRLSPSHHTSGHGRFSIFFPACRDRPQISHHWPRASNAMKPEATDCVTKKRTKTMVLNHDMSATGRNKSAPDLNKFGRAPYRFASARKTFETLTEPVNRTIPRATPAPGGAALS